MEHAHVLSVEDGEVHIEEFLFCDQQSEGEDEEEDDCSCRDAVIGAGFPSESAYTSTCAREDGGQLAQAELEALASLQEGLRKGLRADWQSHERRLSVDGGAVDDGGGGTRCGGISGEDLESSMRRNATTSATVLVPVSVLAPARVLWTIKWLKPQPQDTGELEVEFKRDDGRGFRRQANGHEGPGQTWCGAVVVRHAGRLRLRWRNGRVDGKGGGGSSRRRRNLLCAITVETAPVQRAARRAAAKQQGGEVVNL